MYVPWINLDVRLEYLKNDNQINRRIVRLEFCAEIYVFGYPSLINRTLRITEAYNSTTTVRSRFFPRHNGEIWKSREESKHHEIVPNLSSSSKYYSTWEGQNLAKA